MDRHDLYERCVQSPAELVRLLWTLHGGSPRVLREDFAGTAAVSRAWTARSLDARAEAVDVDLEVLARARGAERVELVHADVCSAGLRERSVDVVFAGNYSIGEIGDRRQLVEYLDGSRRRLRAGGVFVCDTYGGESAWRTGRMEKRHVVPGGVILHHVWEQREVDPIGGRVVNALHFRVEEDGQIVQELRDAFVYRWRLWSVPELLDALGEAGYAEIVVRTRLDGRDLEGVGPLLDEDGRRVREGFAACVAGRVGPGPHGG